MKSKVLREAEGDNIHPFNSLVLSMWVMYPKIVHIWHHAQLHHKKRMLKVFPLAHSWLTHSHAPFYSCLHVTLQTVTPGHSTVLKVSNVSDAEGFSSWMVFLFVIMSADVLTVCSHVSGTNMHHSSSSSSMTAEETTRGVAVEKLENMKKWSINTYKVTE